MLKTYIINGVGESGKNLFIEYINDLIFKNSINNTSIVDYSTVDLPKEVSVLLGWDGVNKSDEARNLISGIKDLWKKFNNGPVVESIELVKILLEDIKHYDENIYLFIHCREPEEILELKEELSKYCETKSILIERPGHKGPNCSKDDLDTIKSIQYDIHHVCREKEDLRNSAIHFLYNETF